MKVFANIIKVDPEKRLVYGYASTTAMDSQKERVSKAALEAALPDYMKFANVREMHQASAVGVAQEAAIDDKGLYLCAKVVDDQAWGKVKEGVYKGFSIGGKRLEKVDDTVTALKITEVSLVDRPANPECVFDVYKAEDGETVAKVAAREDANPKEGEKKYGDVKFADEKNKKYPIDTAEHIRAAWNYINKPANAEKYSAADVKSIKGKIIAAWKAKIDPKGPPSAVAEKAESFSDLQKMLGDEVWDASIAIEALTRLCYLFNKEMKEGNEDQVAALQAVVDNLKAFIASEIMESDDDDNMAMAENPENLTKAANSAQRIHDHSIALGAKCGGKTNKAEDDMDIKKMEDMEKRLGDLATENQDLKERLEKLEAQPADPKVATKAVPVTKAADGGAPVVPDPTVRKADGSVDQEATALNLIKAAHSNPINYSPGR